MITNPKILRAKEGFLWVVCSIPRMCKYNYRNIDHKEEKEVSEKDVPYR
jgi:hypothetical protein